MRMKWFQTQHKVNNKKYGLKLSIEEGKTMWGEGASYVRCERYWVESDMDKYSDITDIDDDANSR